MLADRTTFNRHANGVRAHAVGVGVKQQDAIPQIGPRKKRTAALLVLPREAVRRSGASFKQAAYRDVNLKSAFGKPPLGTSILNCVSCRSLNDGGINSLGRVGAAPI